METTLRMTHQRELILEELARSKKHPTADGLYERVKKRLPRISLATVYRNLEILSEAGMIRKLEISGRQKRFDWQLDPHDHIYCVQCHSVDNIDFHQDCPIALPTEIHKGYIISGCRIEFFGICPKCQKKNKPKKKKKGAKAMACKPKGCKTGGLSDRQREVLEALAKADGTCGSKDIAAGTSLEPKQISCQLTALKKKGFVSSPARCKYEITDDGKTALT
ncbi:MAG: transcriptional repressor [Desulfobulbaceae bacterium]|nr:transcriptional repressor [Desulfobulbaceae bacterium]